MTPQPAEGRRDGLARALDLWVGVPQWFRILVPVAAMATLWWLSSQEPEPQPHSTARALFHNSMHVIAYGCLAASIWLAWSRHPVATLHVWRSRGAWLLASLYGVVDELHQSYVPGRVCSFADFASDAVGAALAVVVLRGISGVAPRSRYVAGLLLLLAFGTIAVATFAGW